MESYSMVHEIALCYRCLVTGNHLNIDHFGDDRTAGVEFQIESLFYKREPKFGIVLPRV